MKPELDLTNHSSFIDLISHILYSIFQANIMHGVDRSLLTHPMRDVPDLGRRHYITYLMTQLAESKQSIELHSCCGYYM
jgi:hypothetical protein